MTEVAEVKTIGDVERIVHGSGLWDGTTPVEFSNDGTSIGWMQAWSPTEQHPHPQFARVSVYRKDVRLPATVTIRWDEQRPRESEEWAAKWDAAPTRHFGRTARMVAFRQMFRDILGDVSIEDEERATPAAAAAPVERDWRAEFEAAADVDALDAIVREARTARVFTPTPEGTSLDIAWKTHRKALLADWTPAKDAWEPAAEAKDATPDLMQNLQDSLRRPAPQDHLPGNRAQRRAKKRGRR